ncbi:MAG TPA: hypothetical protein VG965_00705 [Patescibacteria group bacterium]|nr:hypothetical protein [Patescibacteria group bacterium]
MRSETEYNSIRQERQDSFVDLENASIASSQREYEERDVLGSNRDFAILPELICAGDTNELYRRASAHAAQILGAGLGGFSYEHKLWFHRDFGMIANAATIAIPHQGVAEMPSNLAAAMKKIAAETDLVPRIYDVTYAGPHSRRYTDDKIELRGQQVYREDFFKNGVYAALREQWELTSSMRQAMEVDVQDPALVDILTQADHNLSQIFAAMRLTHQYNAKDGYFAKLIPNLEAYKVDGVQYEHSGSQMAGMLAIDSALGIVTCEDFDGHKGELEGYEADLKSDYESYFNNNVKYLPPVVRRNVIAIQNGAYCGGSIIDKILSEDPEALPEGLLAATYGFVSSLHTIRSVHHSSMKATFGERPDSVKNGTANTMDTAELLYQRTVAKYNEVGSIMRRVNSLHLNTED